MIFLELGETVSDVTKVTKWGTWVKRLKTQVRAAFYRIAQNSVCHI